MRASIIVATRNRWALLRSLLESLAPMVNERPDFEIIVVDDASQIDPPFQDGDSLPPFTMVRVETPTGPSHARNRGAALASGAVLLFLDDDGDVAAGWLDAMLAAESDNTILLGNVVDYHGGRVQSLPRRATFLGKSLRCPAPWANTGPSANLGIPRSNFEALGGFDEALPYYFEDSDLCIRAARSGCKATFVADAVFRHRGNERKTGEAIRMQEHNSTFAMLRIYEGDWPRSLAFTLLNATWLAIRVLGNLLRGRSDHANLLVRGWATAYRRYLHNRL